VRRPRPRKLFAAQLREPDPAHSEVGRVVLDFPVGDEVGEGRGFSEQVFDDALCPSNIGSCSIWSLLGRSRPVDWIKTNNTWASVEGGAAPGANVRVDHTLRVSGERTRTWASVPE
jgi:hypothetical protein